MQVSLTDNSVQEARIHSNDLTNVATAAAALNTHLNQLTFNNTHNNITNTNIQAATAAANAAVAAATQSGIALASASGLVSGGHAHGLGAEPAAGVGLVSQLRIRGRPGTVGRRL